MMDTSLTLYMNPCQSVIEPSLTHSVRTLSPKLPTVSQKTYGVTKSVSTSTTVSMITAAPSPSAAAVSAAPSVAGTSKVRHRSLVFRTTTPQTSCFTQKSYHNFLPYTRTNPYFQPNPFFNPYPHMSQKSAASATLHISEVTTYTASLLVGLVLAMMA